MLAMAVTKKGNLETPQNRAAACRYIALVVRRGNITRPIKNLAALQAIVRPIWEQPDMVLTASAAGLAMGAMALSSAMSDEDVGALADQAVAMAAANGAQAVGGMACLHTLISSVRSRIDDDVIGRAAAAVRAVLPSCGTDRLTALWALRMAALLVTVDPALVGKPEPVQALLKRVEVSDDLMMSTAAAVVANFSKAHPALAEGLQAGKYSESSVWAEVGGFELEFEDEYSSASIVY
uniref:Uncharacterized protein n=1 Tax=Neobodo designis TaxID=312471 RepID=A0A7S1L9S0_NEODS|mmetsp:Transcript_17643/g.54725  ORF Transcript_17643/g.54725 Transcript_17643/m.54725 type:complete len:237 (+) Transcript_17643:272-982(+)